MKKAISLFLASALMVGLAACGGQTNKQVLLSHSEFLW